MASAQDKRPPSHTATRFVLLVLAARMAYPKPEDLEGATTGQAIGTRYGRSYWVYLAGAALCAAGFADLPLIAYHFTQAGTVPVDWIAAFYVVAEVDSWLQSKIEARDAA